MITFNHITSFVAISALAATAAVRADPSPSPGIAKGTCITQRAAVSIVGRIHEPGQTTVVAILTTRATGDALLAQARQQAETQARLRAIGSDRQAMEQYILDEQKAAIANASAQAKTGAHPSELGLPVSLSDGVQVNVANDGSFRCDGVAQGSYDLIAGVSAAAGTPSVTQAGLKVTIYAMRFDVPAAPRGARVIVRANSFGRQFDMAL